MFRKILIANRGEIALRIMRTCNELGIRTVVAHSEADRDSLPVRLADETVCIGPPPTASSYLNIPNIVSAAMLTGSEAIHPGYGLLSENARFAEICADHGLCFIGPAPGAIAQMGDKISALQLMQELGVPTIPGSNGPLNSQLEASKMAREIGYPIIIKAAAGGGGRGMRVVQSPRKLASELELARHEAQIVFGNGELYLEKYLEEPRHVEIQILADRYGNAIHLGERDCSIQRRHQKLIEEAPSPALTTELRMRMGEAALLVVKALRYEGVGTVEFLVDRVGNFYFMEMNTRIQVEHPVTEAITRLDLIALQILVAAGGSLPCKQEDIRFDGHAIECRINAEDPLRDFRPCPGLVDAFVPPGGLGIRVDSHVYPGYIIPPYYDSLIAKLIAWAPDRSQAIVRMQRALGEFAITGVRTTLPIHQRILENAFYQKGEAYTNFLQRRILGS
ncbi:MAG: acetyl-CoA carboxylase biotin carboxylase subunit [Cyanobacteria bacterium NC_groundwater_1444_Ag_S-0.65um_54_12]|nr:acetyl-CoA carboxylase biotin carboxylase subunit [Cyanobacteria bacterium NC_groundwater_1444_Ag_S-0.65um_54_12]